MVNSSIVSTRWRIPCFLQNASASCSSRSGVACRETVSASTPSPSASHAAYNRKTESTPPEKATAAFPSEAIRFFKQLYFCSSSSLYFTVHTSYAAHAAVEDACTRYTMAESTCEHILVIYSQSSSTL